MRDARFAARRDGRYERAEVRWCRKRRRVGRERGERQLEIGCHRGRWSVSRGRRGAGRSRVSLGPGSNPRAKSQAGFSHAADVEAYSCASSSGVRLSGAVCAVARRSDQSLAFVSSIGVVRAPQSHWSVSERSRNSSLLASRLKQSFMESLLLMWLVYKGGSGPVVNRDMSVCHWQAPPRRTWTQWGTRD